MSSVKHAVGVLAAGVIAFGTVIGGAALSPASGLYEQTNSSDASGHGGGEHGGGEHGDASESENANPSQAILGRWQAPEPANQDAYVEFTEYGLWTASDGCNGMDGTWAFDEDGALKTTGSGAMTLIACDNVPIPTTVFSAVEATFPVDGEMVLVSDTGTEFELVRAGDSTTSIAGTWVDQDTRGTDGSEVTFAEDGTWAGSDGCNRVFGNWAIEPVEPEESGPLTEFVLAPGAFTFEIVGMTQMACDTTVEVDVPKMLVEMNGIWLPRNDELSLVNASETVAPEDYTFMTLVRHGA